MLTLVVKPGDVLAVRTSDWQGRLIRAGAGLRELFTGQPSPNLDNHIAVVHHTDPQGNVWCIEGRPGGVGWRVATDYLKSPWTVHNAKQPKTDAQRNVVTDIMHVMLGTPYDWEAIAADAAGAFGMSGLWQPAWHGTVPGHVVCSSLAAYAYSKAALARPGSSTQTREITPANWTAFIMANDFWH
jgi:hypothetical protein